QHAVTHDEVARPPGSPRGDVALLVVIAAAGVLADVDGAVPHPRPMVVEPRSPQPGAGPDVEHTAHPQPPPAHEPGHAFGQAADASSVVHGTLSVEPSVIGGVEDGAWSPRRRAGHPRTSLSSAGATSSSWS